MTNTELSSSGGYVLCWLAERLMSNILIIVKIVPGDEDFIAAGLR
jgi:hypothetical protein